MNLRLYRGQKNALVRRVRHHASLATLFRAADPLPLNRPTGQAEASASGAYTQPVSGIIQAKLGSVTRDLPIGFVIDNFYSAKASSPQVEPPFTTVKVSPPLAGEHEERRKPARSHEEGSEADAIEWRRLQAIFQMHLEKQATEKTAYPLIVAHPSVGQGKSINKKVLQVRGGTTQVDQQKRHKPDLQPRSTQPRESLQTKEDYVSPEVDKAEIDPATTLAPEVVPDKRRPGELQEAGPFKEPSTIQAQSDVLSQPESMVARDTGQPENARAPFHDTTSKPDYQRQEISDPVPTLGKVDEAREPDLAERISAEQSQPAMKAEEREGSAEADIVVIPSAESATERTTLRTKNAKKPNRALSGSTKPKDQTISEAETQLQAGEKPPVHTAELLPLQAVWPVHQQEELSTSTESALDVDVPSENKLSNRTPSQGIIQTGPTNILTRSSEKEPGEPAPQEASLSVFSQVIPGQPTDSSIDIITPSRPRPEPYDKLRSIEQQGSESFEESGSVQNLERGPDHFDHGSGLDQVKGQPELNHGTSRTITEGEPFKSSGKAVSSYPMTEDPRIDLVQTDIGPLPADLWDLLGEPSPDRSVQKRSLPRPAPIGADHESIGTHTVPAAEVGPVKAKPHSLKRLATPDRISPPLQRAVMPAVDAGTADLSAHQPVRGEAESGGEGEIRTPGLDMDELSRRVYAEIKRRLSIELERVRRRF